MKPSVIVWDLETVPDPGGFAAANLRRPLPLLDPMRTPEGTALRAKLAHRAV
jgi:hypothetical protein